MKSLFKQQVMPLLAVAVASAIAPQAAHATAGDITVFTILNSSPLWNSGGGATYHACTVANVTTAAVNTRVELINGSGVVIATTGATTWQSIPPGESRELMGSSSYSGFARCRVTLPNSADAVRGNFTVFHFLNGYFETLGTSEVR